MADDLKKFIKEQGEETRRHFDKKAVETQRHFDVVAEDLTSTISQVAEGVSVNSDLVEQLTKRVAAIEEGLDNLQGMRSSIESMREDVLKIRVHLESLQGKVEKKPSFHDLSALDKRVWRLERKLQGA